MVAGLHKTAFLCRKKTERTELPGARKVLQILWGFPDGEGEAGGWKSSSV